VLLSTIFYVTLAFVPAERTGKVEGVQDFVQRMGGIKLRSPDISLVLGIICLLLALIGQCWLTYHPVVWVPMMIFSMPAFGGVVFVWLSAIKTQLEDDPAQLERLGIQMVQSATDLSVSGLRQGLSAPMAVAHGGLSFTKGLVTAGIRAPSRTVKGSAAAVKDAAKSSAKRGKKSAKDVKDTGKDVIKYANPMNDGEDG